MSTSYKTVRALGSDELVEKRSRFIGYCKPVATERDAIEFINKIKKDHWDARHNVYAYCLREGHIKRYSDDGEPQGTAGMPILDVMLKNNVVDAVVVVTRYFGGILLGTGGLVRAYSAGCKIALNAAEIVTMQLCSECSVTCSYTQYGKLNTLIISGGGYIDDTDFSEDVTLRFHIPTELIPSLDKQFADATAGKISTEIICEKYHEIT